MDDDFLVAKTNPDALWDYELNDYANPEYRATKELRVPALTRKPREPQ